MEKQLNIFISSTYLDLKKERKLVAEIIHRLGHNALGMEFFSAGRRTQWENITEWIDKSDVFVVLTKCRYGTIFQNDKSYTECEVDYEDIYYEAESDYAITVDEEIKKDIKEIKEVATFQNDTCIKCTVLGKYHKKIIPDFDLLYTYKYGNILKGIRRIKKIRFIEFYIRHYPEYENEGVYYFPSEIWKCITKKDVKPDMTEEELRDLIIRTDEYKMCLVLAQNESHKTFNTSENDFIFGLIDFAYIKENVKKLKALGNMYF